MTKIIMHGLGAMGNTIIDLCKNKDDVKIVAGVAPITNREYDFPIYSSIDKCVTEADVIIDFSTASAINGLLKFCATSKTPLVLCTTGLDESTNKLIEETSCETAIFHSANMSIGINIVSNVLNKISKELYNLDFDIEIVEKHHNNKVDAPSGTALLLKNVIQSNIEELTPVYNRADVLQKRNRNEIGLHAVRGGTICGEHEVIFAGKDEIIEVKHSALSKDVFAVGAINASKYISQKSNGIYNMSNMLKM